jgi:hypothetical protein
MAKFKLDTAKIKEFVTKRYEVVALGAGAALAVICLLLGIGTFFGASSPDQDIVKTAATVERGRMASPPSDEAPKVGPSMRLTDWGPVGPNQARLVLTRPFFSPGDAGDNRRFMPKILTMDKDPNSFQLDYLHRGVFVYDAHDTQKKLKVFPVPEAQQGTVDPVFLVIDKRMVVVSGLFPYYAQSEEYKKALRFDDLKAMFAEGLAPTFESLIVERRKITKGEDGKDKIGEWEMVYGVDPETGKTQPSPSVSRLLQTCLYDSAQVDKYSEVIFGASVTPLPLIATPLTQVAGKFEYPDIKIPAIAKAMVAAPATPPVGTSGTGPSASMMKGKSAGGPGDLAGPGMKGMQTGGSPQAGGRSRLMYQPTTSAQARNPQSQDYDTLPKDLQDQLNGNLNWTSPYGTFVDEPGKGDEAKGGGDGKKEGDPTPPGPGPKGGRLKGAMPGPTDMQRGEGGMFDAQSQGANLKAPTYPPNNPMALVRFVDVDVAAGAEYQYRIAVRLANPNYKLSTKLVANAGWTKNKDLASDWVETPRISIPEEYHYYVINQTKGFVSRIRPHDDPNRNTTNDATAPANAYKAERIPFQFHKYVGTFQTPDLLTRYVADWEVAERVLIGKGEALGREVEVEAIAWNSGKGQFEYASTASKTVKNPKLQGSSGLPVDFRPPQPIVLLDYVGGEVRYAPKSGAAPILDRECATEALLLLPDGTMIVRNSRHDMDDRGYDNAKADLGGHWLGIERRQRVEEWRARHEDFRKDAAKTMLPPDAGKKGSGIN